MPKSKKRSQVIVLPDEILNDNLFKRLKYIAGNRDFESLAECLSYLDENKSLKVPDFNSLGENVENFKSKSSIPAKKSQIKDSLTRLFEMHGLNSNDVAQKKQKEKAVSKDDQSDESETEDVPLKSKLFTREQLDREIELAVKPQQKLFTREQLDREIELAVKATRESLETRDDRDRSLRIQEEQLLADLAKVRAQRAGTESLSTLASSSELGHLSSKKPAESLDFYDGQPQNEEVLTILKLLKYIGIDLEICLKTKKYVEPRHFIRAIKLSAGSLVQRQKNAKYLNGFSSDFKFRDVVTKKDVCEFLSNYILLASMFCSAEYVGQLTSLQKIVLAYLENSGVDESTAVEVIMQYVTRMMRERLSVAARTNSVPDFTTIEQAHFSQSLHQYGAFITAQAGPARKISVMRFDTPARKQTRQETSSDESDAEEPDTIAPVSPKPAAKCFAFNLIGGCKTKDCGFCARGGNYCLSCNSFEHGAALCDDSSMQQAYFRSVITPIAKHPYGLDPIYGGNALKILGFKSGNEFSTAEKSKLLGKAVKDAIRDSLAESERLRAGGKATRATTYPLVRSH